MKATRLRVAAGFAICTCTLVSLTLTGHALASDTLTAVSNDVKEIEIRDPKTGQLLERIPPESFALPKTIIRETDDSMYVVKHGGKEVEVDPMQFEVRRSPIAAPCSGPDIGRANTMETGTRGLGEACK
jgi:hypothetical protein